MKDYANKKSLIGAVPRRFAREPVMPTLARSSGSVPKMKSKSASSLRLVHMPVQFQRLPKWAKPVVVAVVVILVVALIAHACHKMQLGQVLSDKATAIKTFVDEHRHPRAATNTVPVSTDNASGGTAPAAAPPVPTSNQPVFDFYTVLPNRRANTNVEAGGDQANATNTQNAAQGAVRSQNKATEAAGSVPLVLIAGNYQNQEEAEKMRAHLFLIGLMPTVKQVNGQYQVQLGPFESQKALEAAKVKIQRAKLS